MTVLSDMVGPMRLGPAGNEPARMLGQAAAWGLTTIDLKTVCGKNIADLSDAECDVVAAALNETSISVEAFSTQLLKLDLEDGAVPFERHLALLDRTLAVARRLRPRKIRLLAAETRQRHDVADIWPLISRDYPWLVEIYGEAADRIHAAGFQAVIENETDGCIFSKPPEIVAFFEAMALPDRIRFTWDVQNLWQMGTFPTIEVYRALQPYIGYFHVKGGRSGKTGSALAWRSPLGTASWPVVEITRAVLADGVSPVICLNPSHGKISAGEDDEDYTLRDLAFLRTQFPELS